MNLRKTNTVQVLKLLNLLKMVIDCSGLKRLNLRCSAWWTGVGNMSLVKGLNSMNCSSFLLTTQNIQIWKNFSWRKTLRNYQHQIVDICNKRFVWSWYLFYIVYLRFTVDSKQEIFPPIDMLCLLIGWAAHCVLADNLDKINILASFWEFPTFNWLICTTNICMRKIFKD